MESEGVEVAEATLWEHLEELVIRLRRIIIAIIIMGFILSIIPYRLDPYTPVVVVLPRLLLSEAIPEKIVVFGEVYDVRLAQFNPFSGFNIMLQSAILLGVIGASPVIAYEVAAYLSPALYPNEKRVLKRLAVVALILFIIGIFFAYYIILPWTFRFLFVTSVVVAGEEGLVAYADIGRLFSLAVKLVVATGLIFEIPLILYILLINEIIDIEKFRGDGMKYAFIVSLIIGALISADPTGVGMLIIALPYYALIWIAVKLADIQLRKKASAGVESA
jgi:sec-independent protein translocase protein TatC